MGCFYSARGVLLSLCLQNIFEMDYENKLKRYSKCGDELWDEMIKNQRVVMKSLMDVIKENGIDSAIPHEVQEKLKSIVRV